jgi:hypothetical protein
MCAGKPAYLQAKIHNVWCQFRPWNGNVWCQLEFWSVGHVTHQCTCVQVNKTICRHKSMMCGTFLGLKPSKNMWCCLCKVMTKKHEAKENVRDQVYSSKNAFYLQAWNGNVWCQLEPQSVGHVKHTGIHVQANKPTCKPNCELLLNTLCP